MYKAIKKNKAICRYMEALAIRTVEQTVHWEDNTRCVYDVEAKIFTPRVRHIGIHVFFLK